MTSAIPVAQYPLNHPRNPHSAASSSSCYYSSYYTPRSSSPSYYPSSSASTQQTTYWPNAHASSVSTASSIPPSSSSRRNPGLVAAQFVTKKTRRIHKRARSDPEQEENMLEEVWAPGYVTPPAVSRSESPFGKLKPPTLGLSKSRVAIKPLLKKVTVSSRGNSLDLSRSDGGIPGGVGLGIYDSYDSSGLEDVDRERLDTAFPKNPRRSIQKHRRNISNNSAGSLTTPVHTTSAQHPQRQLPRRGVETSDRYYYRDAHSSSNDDSDSEDEEFRQIRRRVLAGHGRTEYTSGAVYTITSTTVAKSGGASAPILPSLATSMSDVHSYSHSRNAPSTQHQSSSNLTSPITPITPESSLPPTASHPSLPLSEKKSKRSSRSTRSTNKSTTQIRSLSPSFAESVTAARKAWEAKEEKKEEKRERKRRQSEERRTSLNLVRPSRRRERGTSGSTTGEGDESWRPSFDMEETQEDDEEESEDEVYYGRETEEWKEKQRRKMEKEERRQAKWGVFARSGERSGAGSPRLRSRQNMATPPPSAENAVTTEGYAYEATTTVMDEKAAIARSGKRGRKGGLKRRWTELVVWCRIGMVRLRRKMGL